MKFVKKEKIGEGAYPKTCALFPENVDDFLEVERRGNKVAGSLFYFIDFIDYKLFYILYFFRCRML